MQVTVATVAAARHLDNQPVDLYIFCANTYNWRPDWAVSNFIEKEVALNGKSVVAITLGGVSTEASQRVLEKLIVENKGKLLDSRPVWLLRPNDESKMTNPTSRLRFQWHIPGENRRLYKSKLLWQINKQTGYVFDI